MSRSDPACTSVRLALGTIVAAAVLAGCNGFTAPFKLPTEASQPGRSFLAQNAGASYRLVLSFTGTNGANPVASLTARHGQNDPLNAHSGPFYGTTRGGGANDLGTVFSITPAGAEHVLYSFKGGNDGAHPQAGLTVLNGILYGTTSDGGPKQRGTVYSLSVDGKERVLYAFKGGNDGRLPEAGLTNVNGTLYGTTAHGGLFDFGTVFRITTAGRENVLYSFLYASSAYGDGYPQAGLVAINDTLYGTTLAGYGAVYSVTTSGSERVLYEFRGQPGEPALPFAGLTVVGGKLYGTTYAGGTDASCSYDGAVGCGTVFSVTTGGKERVLHSFGSGSDGEQPKAGLTILNGVLYGTTTAGGTNGLGTIFRMTPAGKERVLYSFRGGRGDGDDPIAGLAHRAGTLYGTTYLGGRHNVGTIFAFTP